MSILVWRKIESDSTIYEFYKKFFRKRLHERIESVRKTSTIQTTLETTTRVIIRKRALLYPLIINGVFPTDVNVGTTLVLLVVDQFESHPRPLKTWKFEKWKTSLSVTEV